MPEWIWIIWAASLIITFVLGLVVGLRVRVYVHNMETPVQAATSTVGLPKDKKRKARMA